MSHTQEIRSTSSPFVTTVVIPSKESVWRPFLLTGMLLIAIGIVAVAVPFLAALVVDLFAATLLLACSVSYGIHAVSIGRFRTAIWSGIWAVVYFAVAVAMLFAPMSGILTLALLIAAAFVVEGTSKVFLSLRGDSLMSHPLLLWDGLLGTAIGVLIWLRWPSDAVWVLGLLVGVRFLFAGAMLASIGLRLKRPIRFGAAQRPAGQLEEQEEFADVTTCENAQSKRNG